MTCSNGEHETQSAPLQNNINPHSKNLSQFLLLDTTCPVPSKKKRCKTYPKAGENRNRKDEAFSYADSDTKGPTFSMGEFTVRRTHGKMWRRSRRPGRTEGNSDRENSKGKGAGKEKWDDCCENNASDELGSRFTQASGKGT